MRITRTALDRTDEAIAPFRERLNKARTGRGVSEGASQLAGCLVDRPVKVNEGAVGPQSMTKLFSGDNAASLLDKREQQTQRLFTQPEPETTFSKLA